MASFRRRFVGASRYARLRLEALESRQLMHAGGLTHEARGLVAEAFLFPSPNSFFRMYSQAAPTSMSFRL